MGGAKRNPGWGNLRKGNPEGVLGLRSAARTTPLASSPKTLLPVTNHQNIPAALFLQALRPRSPRLASQQTGPRLLQ